MKKIVIASDSFKGSLSSKEIADCLKNGFLTYCPHCEVTGVQVADGGEGTVCAISSLKSVKKLTSRVEDPLGRIIPAEYAIDSDGTALIEMSAASGLPLLSQDERNPLITSTFGTGELILAALENGCRNFIIGIGGSATNDAGTGMLCALGARFLDKDSNELKGCGASLESIETIDLSKIDARLRECKFSIACDVSNPFFGPQGAAFVFGPQKGADARTVERLDNGLRNFAGAIHRQMGIDISSLAGAGAAGGIGGAFVAFLGAELKRGVDVVLDSIEFDKIIKGADLVITGEGRMDFQTPSGKTPSGVLRRAKMQGIDTVAVAGCVKSCAELDAMGFKKIYATAQPGVPLEVALTKEYTGRRLQQIALQILEENEA